MKTKAPLVSIIMPVYNAGPYLYQAVQSIFAQTFADWELIMIDDASEDCSWEIMNKINDPRIVLLQNKINMKQSYSQNRGIEIARGKWIFRMDADDLSLPKRMEKQLTILESTPEIDVISCGSINVYNNMKPYLITRPVATHKEIVRIASMNFPLLHGGLMGKISWFKKWKANPKMRFAQDFDIFFRAHKESTFCNISDILYVVRFVGGTTPVSRKIQSIYYKSLSLLQNGFKMGLYKDTIIGLASMMPRPLLYLIKARFGKNEMGLISSQGIKPTQEDVVLLESELTKIHMTEVPFRK